MVPEAVWTLRFQLCKPKCFLDQSHPEAKERVLRRNQRYEYDTGLDDPNLYANDYKRRYTVTRLDDADLVGDVEGVVVGGEPHVRLLRAVGG